MLYPHLLRSRILCGTLGTMDEFTDPYAAIRDALSAAEAGSAAAALPHLRAAAERLTALIDESMATALLEGSASLRAAGAAAGLSENAVGPRLARTAALGAYANATGRVTADGVRRAQFDAEVGLKRPAALPAAPMRFKPRRTTPKG